jgi:hypothetical protein
MLTRRDYGAEREFWLFVLTEINILAKSFLKMCHGG